MQAETREKLRPGGHKKNAGFWETLFTENSLRPMSQLKKPDSKNWSRLPADYRPKIGAAQLCGREE
jgi:hypothetical protein